MTWSHSTTVALAVIPKVSASLSMAGSLLILQEVCRAPERRKLPYHRLLAGLSLADLISSFGYFLGTWPIPRGTPGVYAALGTQRTCDAAGFFNILIAPVAPLYNAALALYYLATIRYNWTNRRIAQFEKIFHPILWLIGVACAITGLQLDMYNNIENLVCSINHSPRDCLDSLKYGDELANCERGDNAFIYQWAFYLVPGWGSFLVMISCLTSVYFAVLKIERRRDSYRFNSSESDGGDRSKSRRIFGQGVWYAVAFVSSWFFQTFSRVLFEVTGGKTFATTAILIAIFMPLQGFWNFLIYRRQSIAARLSPVLLSLQQYFCCLCRSGGGGGQDTEEDQSGKNNDSCERGQAAQKQGFLASRFFRRSHDDEPSKSENNKKSPEDKGNSQESSVSTVEMKDSSKNTAGSNNLSTDFAVCKAEAVPHHHTGTHEDQNMPSSSGTEEESKHEEEANDVDEVVSSSHHDNNPPKTDSKCHDSLLGSIQEVRQAK